MWQRNRSWLSDLLLVNVLDWVSTGSLFGSWLYNQAECFSANDHKERSSVPISVQCNDIFTMNVCAICIMVWIAHSDHRFWWWSPTPENMSLHFVITINPLLIRGKYSILPVVMVDFCCRFHPKPLLKLFLSHLSIVS